VPLSDLVRNVGDVMSRADTLFGTADPNAPATAAADQLTDATDAIRSAHEQAASMTGDALTNYADFVQGSRDTLDQLSGVESDMGRRLQEAADAVTAAKAASQSALEVVSSASAALDQLPESPAAELAVINAMRVQVGHELELIRTHQAIAAQLGEQLRGLDY
jgi:methyl-accepting chemotaxis protein